MYEGTGILTGVFYYDIENLYINWRVIFTEMSETRTTQEKILLNIKEFCDYLGIGQTKARELLKMPRNGYAIKIGSKWYVHKQRLDAWLLEQCDKY